jgi:hypothetical protein
MAMMKACENHAARIQAHPPVLSSLTCTSSTAVERLAAVRTIGMGTGWRCRLAG